MDEARAREILGETIQEDGSLYNGAHYISWSRGWGVVLDDLFELEELEAIVWWMQNYPTNGKPRG